MSTNVVALFDDRDEAQRAVHDLLAAGVSQQRISFLASDPDGRLSREVSDDEGNMAAEGAATGLTTGALVGGALGLLLGAGIIFLPIGLAVAGPLAGLIAGGAAGAATGGILGGLVGMGIPAEHAEVYAESVRRGSTLLSVDVDQHDLDRVHQILDRDGAVNIEDRAAAYRSAGFSGYNPEAPAYSVDEVQGERARHESTSPLDREQEEMAKVRARVASYVRSEPPAQRSDVPDGRAAVDQPDEFAQYHDVFHNDFQNRYSDAGMSFEQFQPAYRFGFEAATDHRFHGFDWSVAEPVLRQEWEAQSKGSWETFANAIRAGWSRSHSRQTDGVAELL